MASGTINPAVTGRVTVKFSNSIYFRDTGSVNTGVVASYTLRLACPWNAGTTGNGCGYISQGAMTGDAIAISCCMTSTATALGDCSGMAIITAWWRCQVPMKAVNCFR